ncbi:hypothetical protein NMY22_g15185 [Coprinellus aureogranulatus]|nr:hypothetical protein NMY22_g15185 [Coprinellus aureogranulatus]
MKGVESDSGPVPQPQIGEKGMKGKRKKRRTYDIKICTGAPLATSRYVYAYTVVRYVETGAGSRDERWKSIVGWATAALGVSPPPLLSAGDWTLYVLYEGILSVAKRSYEIENPKGPGFMLLLRVFIAATKNTDFEYSCLPCLLGLEEGTLERLTRDIRSLVKLSLPRGDEPHRLRDTIQFHHSSCEEFLENQTDATHLRVTDTQMDEYVLGACLRCFLANVDEALRLEHRVMGQEDTSDWTHFSMWYLCKMTTPEARWERATGPLVGPTIYTTILAFTQAGGWVKVLQWFELRKRISAFPNVWKKAAEQLQGYLCVVLDDLKAPKNRALSRKLKGPVKKARRALEQFVEGEWPVEEMFLAT